jgi:hypothetical protein
MLRQGSAELPSAFTPQWMLKDKGQGGVRHPGAAPPHGGGPADAVLHPAVLPRAQASASSSGPAADKPSPSPQQRRSDDKPWVTDRWGDGGRDRGQEAGDTKWGAEESRLARWAEDDRQRIQPARREPARCGRGGGGGGGGEGGGGPEGGATP